MNSWTKEKPGSWFSQFAKGNKVSVLPRVIIISLTKTETIKLTIIF